MQDYDSMSKLVTSTNDGDEVSKFLMERGFSITRIHDEDYAKITDAFSDLDKKLANAKNIGKTVAFIYFSGHGVIVNGQTVGISVPGNRFQLEEKIRNMSLRSNCLVIGFLDCCREIVPEFQKGSVPNITKGHLFLIYAVGPGKYTVTKNHKDKLSEVTNDLLNVLRTSVMPFPDCVESWANFHPTVEFVEKVQYKFNLSNIVNSGNAPVFVPPSKNFKYWQPHEICSWFLTLALNEDYSKRIMHYKITGAGLLALIKENEMINFGFDNLLDNVILKNAVEECISS